MYASNYSFIATSSSSMASTQHPRDIKIQECVFRADRKTKMTALSESEWLRYIRLSLRTEFDQTWLPYENSISIPYGKVTESLRTCWGKIFLEEFLKILKKAITESWCHWGILKFTCLTYSITSLSLIFASASWEISLKTGSKIIRHLHKAWLHSNILVLKQKFGLYIYLYKM